MAYAIIKRINEAAGERIYTMGTGYSEAQARQAAFAKVNNGHNMYGEEYTDGELVKCDEHVIEVEEAGYFPSVKLENGVLVTEQEYDLS